MWFFVTEAKNYTIEGRTEFITVTPEDLYEESYITYLEFSPEKFKISKSNGFIDTTPTYTCGWTKVTIQASDLNQRDITDELSD